MKLRGRRVAMVRLLLHRGVRAAAIGACSSLSLSCAQVGVVGRIVGSSLGGLFTSPAPAPVHVDEIVPRDSRLSALWIGHATVLVQVEDKFILTDPVFTQTVGQVSRRLVEPGLQPAELPPIDAVLISHLHFDHLSLGSLDLIESKVRRLFVPKGGAVYLPNSHVLPIELATGQSFEAEGLTVTAAPVGHVGWRYGLDRDWMLTSYTGYVVQYRGIKLYFGGDTSFVPQAFSEVRERFAAIDLALLPIAPFSPRWFMCRGHIGPEQALEAMRLMNASSMLPIHFDTFINSTDRPGDAPRRLRQALREQGFDARRAPILKQGERHVFLRP